MPVSYKRKDSKKYLKKHKKYINKTRRKQKKIKKMNGGGDSVIFKINIIELIAEMKKKPNSKLILDYDNNSLYTLTIKLYTEYNDILLTSRIIVGQIIIRSKIIKYHSTTSYGNSDLSIFSTIFLNEIQYFLNIFNLGNINLQNYKSLNPEENFYIKINNLEQKNERCLSFENIIFIGTKKSYVLESIKGIADDKYCSYDFKTIVPTIEKTNEKEYQDIIKEYKEYEEKNLEFNNNGNLVL
jgi:hypothetical protein